jgi:hypothetical protein
MPELTGDLKAAFERGEVLETNCNSSSMNFGLLRRPYTPTVFLTAEIRVRLPREGYLGK